MIVRFSDSDRMEGSRAEKVFVCVREREREKERKMSCCRDGRESRVGLFFQQDGDGSRLDGIMDGPAQLHYSARGGRPRGQGPVRQCPRHSRWSRPSPSLHVGWGVSGEPAGRPRPGVRWRIDCNSVLFNTARLLRGQQVCHSGHRGGARGRGRTRWQVRRDLLCKRRRCFALNPSIAEDATGPGVAWARELESRHFSGARPGQLPSPWPQQRGCVLAGGRGASLAVTATRRATESCWARRQA